MSIKAKQIIAIIILMIFAIIFAIILIVSFPIVLVVAAFFAIANLFMWALDNCGIDF